MNWEVKFKMYEKLLEPAKLGNVKLKNHVVMAPTETHFCSTDGMITQKDIDYYVMRAKGGVGLIITTQIQGATKIDPIDPYPRSPRLDDNCYIPMMGELVDQVHEAGAKIAALISVGGGAQSNGKPYEAGLDGIREVKNVAPGTVACPVNGREVRQLTRDEIHQMVKVYGMSCLRAKKAGFDAVDIHAHGGYLLAEFLSPFYNNRTDEYGGSFENRTRVLFEIIDEVKKQCGPKFPIIVRFAADEGIGEAGRQLPESIELAKKLEAAGVTALDIGAGTAMSAPLICPTVYHPKATFTDYSKAIRDAVSIPVIVQGRLSDPEVAEQVLEEEKADFIAIGRGLVCEPDWVNKVKENRVEDIRRCLSCNYCHGERIMNSRTIRCTFNPIAGREWKYMDGIKKAENKKKVAVIGAGPAGMEAAYTAALRGHTVDLYDKADSLGKGDQLLAASTPPGKGDLNNITSFYSHAFEKLDNVTLHLGTEVDKDMILGLQADEIILATGGTPVVPPIPGVKDNPKVTTANDILLKRFKPEGRVVIAGGGQVGIETAHLLKEEGFDVDVLEMLPMMEADGEIMTKFTLLPMLMDEGVGLHVSHRIERVEKDAVVATDLKTGEEKEFAYDTFVLALGKRPDNPLEEVLQQSGRSCHSIGDADRPGNIAKAIDAGFTCAMNL